MAKKFTEAGIERGRIVQDEHVLQLTDALRGDDAFEVRLSGSIHIGDVLYASASGNDQFGQTLILDNSGPTSSFSFGFPTASFITSSNVHGPFGTGSVESASYAGTASYAITALNVDFEDIVSVTYADSLTDTVVPVTHLFESKDVVVQAYAADDTDPTQFLQVIPVEIRIVDDNTVNVTVSPSNNGGYVVVGQSGFLTAGSITNAVTASYALNAANTAGFNSGFTNVQSLTVNHGLNTRFVDVTIYDENFQIILPRNITSLNMNQVNVQFAGPTTGTILVK